MGYDLSSPTMTPEMVHRIKGGSPSERAERVRRHYIAAEVSLIEGMAGIVAEARYRKVGRTGVILTGGEIGRDRPCCVHLACHPHTG